MDMSQLQGAWGNSSTPVDCTRQVNHAFMISDVPLASLTVCRRVVPICAGSVKIEKQTERTQGLLCLKRAFAITSHKRVVSHRDWLNGNIVGETFRLDVSMGVS